MKLLLLTRYGYTVSKPAYRHTGLSYRQIELIITKLSVIGIVIPAKCPYSIEEGCELLITAEYCVNIKLYCKFSMKMGFQLCPVQSTCCIANLKAFNSYGDIYVFCEAPYLQIMISVFIVMWSILTKNVLLANSSQNKPIFSSFRQGFPTQ